MMKANKTVVEVSDLPFDYIRQIGSLTPHYFRLGVGATLIAESKGPCSTVKAIIAELDSLSALGSDFYAFIDILGRLSGFIAYRMLSQSEAQIVLFRSSFGAASSLIRSFAGRLDVSVEKVTCANRLDFNYTLNNHLNKRSPAPYPVASFEQYWRRVEGTASSSATKDLISQFSCLGFALCLCSNQKDFFNLPFPAFYKLIAHPAALHQLTVLQDGCAEPTGLTAWALVEEAKSNLTSVDLDRFQDLSEWRNGTHRLPVWQL